LSLKKEAVRDLLKEGYAINAIAREVNMNEANVRKVKRELEEAGEFTESGWVPLSTIEEAEEEIEAPVHRVPKTSLARKEFQNVTEFVIALLKASKDQEVPYTVEEVAQMAHVTPKTVKNTLSRIRQGQYAGVNISDIKLRMEAPWTPPFGEEVMKRKFLKVSLLGGIMKRTS
jgi:predicted transcriptional regulator